MSYTFENAGNPNSRQRTSRLTRVNASSANPDVALLRARRDPRQHRHPSVPRLPAGADCIAADSGTHTLGALHFAPDGTLFVGIGDGADGFVDRARCARRISTAPAARSCASTRTAPPPDNPFYDGTNSALKVWLYGVRNPFRFALHPVTEI